MKTIKDLAEELGVSKVAVLKKTEKLNIKKDLIRNGNKLLIPENLENVLRVAFNKDIENSDSKEREKIDKEREKSETITQSVILMLQKELDEKNKQIESLQSIIDQEQKLRIIAEQRLVAIEEKQKENDNQDVKQGFWSRLFGKKPVDSTATEIPPEESTGQEGNV